MNIVVSSILSVLVTIIGISITYLGADTISESILQVVSPLAAIIVLILMGLGFITNQNNEDDNTKEFGELLISILIGAGVSIASAFVAYIINILTFTKYVWY